MAVAVTLLEADVDATGSNNPYSSGSVSPSADATLLLGITTRVQGGRTDQICDDISGGGLTWTSVYQLHHDTGGTESYLQIWRAETGSSPGSFSMTMGCDANPVGIHWHMYEITGTDLTSDNGVEQYAQNSTPSGAGSITTTFGTSPAADSAVLQFNSIQESNSTTFVEDSGFTEGSKVGPSEAEQSAVQYIEASSPDAIDGEWSGQSGPIGAVAVEVIAESVGSPATVTPGTIVATTGVATPAVTAASVVEPGTIAATTGVATPTVTAAATVTPGTIAAATVVATPTVDVSGAATVTPGTITAVAAVATPTVTAASTVEPGTIVATTVVATPAVTIAATVTPGTIVATTVVATPAVTIAPTVTPDTIAATTTVDTPAITAASTVEPDTIAAVTAVATPTVAAAATVTPGTIAATTTVPSPTAGPPASATVQPSSIAVTTTVTVPTVVIKAKFYDRGRFFRNSSDQFILAVGIDRSVATAFKGGEGWEKCSGSFAVPTGGKANVVDDIDSVWAANKAADTATLTSLVNTALNDAGYRRPNGADVT